MLENFVRTLTAFKTLGNNDYAEVECTGLFTSESH